MKGLASLLVVTIPMTIRLRPCLTGLTETKASLMYELNRINCVSPASFRHLAEFAVVRSSARRQADRHQKDDIESVRTQPPSEVSWTVPEGPVE